MTERTPSHSPEQQQPPDPRMLVALLADPVRLRVFAALVLAPEPDGADVPELAEAARVPVRDAAKALGRLEAVGLAARTGGGNGFGSEGGMGSGIGSGIGLGNGSGMGSGVAADPGRAGWRALPQTLRLATAALAHQRDEEDVPGLAPDTSPQAAAVLRNFFSKGRLTHIPPAYAKRMIVLDFIAQSFDPGVRYPEPRVNEILVRFHEDYAALRRYLVDAGFLSRSESLYWRTGGTVEI